MLYMIQYYFFAFCGYHICINSYTIITNSSKSLQCRIPVGKHDEFAKWRIKMVIILTWLYNNITSWRDGYPSTCVYIAFISATNSSHTHTLTRQMLMVSFSQGRLSMCIVLKVFLHVLINFWEEMYEKMSEILQRASFDFWLVFEYLTWK